MGSQHQNESKSSPEEGRQSGRQAQRRSDDHTNSARAGENPNRADESSAADQQQPPHGQQPRSGQ